MIEFGRRAPHRHPIEELPGTDRRFARIDPRETRLGHRRCRQRTALQAGDQGRDAIVDESLLGHAQNPCVHKMMDDPRGARMDSKIHFLYSEQ